MLGLKYDLNNFNNKTTTLVYSLLQAAFLAVVFERITLPSTTLGSKIYKGMSQDTGIFSVRRPREVRILSIHSSLSNWRKSNPS